MNSSKKTPSTPRSTPDPIGEIKGKRIFFAALDWGLGHVTRSSVILRNLLKNNQVVVGTSVATEFYYQENFQGVARISLPSYEIRYARFLPAWLKVLLSRKRIAKVIQHEHALTEELVEGHQFDLIVSDSRYGVYSTKCQSIIISHQLNMQVPFLKNAVNHVHKRMLQPFSEIWVPDYSETESRLAGKLSDGHRLQNPMFYIGPLSAMEKCGEPPAVRAGSVLILLSGPEPQRTLLESKLATSLQHWPDVTVIRGTTDGRNKCPATFNVLDRPSRRELNSLLCVSDIIICRSGYSTLMDLHCLGKKKFILIPTPGQPEQEYLAEHWQRQFAAKVIEQGQITAQTVTAAISRIR